MGRNLLVLPYSLLLCEDSSQFQNNFSLASSGTQNKLIKKNLVIELPHCGYGTAYIKNQKKLAHVRAGHSIAGAHSMGKLHAIYKINNIQKY